MATEKQIEITNGQFPTNDQPNNDESRTALDFESIKINQGPKMGKVPEILRLNKDHEDCFTPLLMALGPYHHRGRKHGEELKIQLMQEGEQRLINYAPPGEKLKIRMVQEEEQQLNYKRGEELKIQLMQKFYKDEATSSSYQRDYQKVVAVTSEVRECYSEDSTKDMNDADFAKMMVLDGCAILQFISCAVNEDWGRMNIKNHEIALIIHDLFLLENQLPSFVLKKFIEGTQNNIKDKFEKFIEKTRQAPQPPTSCLANIADFFYNRRAAAAAAAAAMAKKRGKVAQQKINNHSKSKKEEDEEKEPLHLLECLWKYYVHESEYNDQTPDNTMDWYTFRSAKELKASGILFSASKTSRFTEVKYKPLPLLHISYLCLPPIVVDDSTKSLLLNLASYEMSSDSKMINAVCSYICFMDSLIDHKEDVVELRRKRIILNSLGSDDMVASLFNDVAKDLVPDPKGFRHVKKDIEKHYRSWFKTWITEWIHTHFSNPWAILVFLGALAGLAMTFIQTYVTLRDFLNGKK